MDFSKLSIWFSENLGDWQFIASIFIVVFCTLLINFIWKRLQIKLHAQLKKTKNTWDDAFFIAAAKPISVIIWLIGLWVIVHFIFKIKIEPVYQDIALVVIGSWFLIRLIREIENNLFDSNKTKSDDEKIDPSTIEAISKLTRVSVIITSVLVVLQTMGVSIGAVLAFGGIGGIAVGFAAKDLLANFFGGLIIYLDRPFSIGDWIRSADREIEGTVEYIGWRQTRIRTFDKRPLYVPNAIFNNITVENPSRMQNRRIYETIGIRYDDINVMQPVVEQVESMLRNHQAIDSQQTLMVNFNAFSASSIDFFVYTFTKTTNWIEFHQIKQEILLKISAIIQANGADIAYPTQRLQLENIEQQTQPEP